LVEYKVFSTYDTATCFGAW